MAFLRSGPLSEPELVIRGDGVRLRPPAPADYAQWADLRGRSRAHLTPYEPAWSAEELSRWSYRRRLRQHQRDAREDLGYAFFVFKGREDSLIGGLTLSNVRRGVTQAVSLGYWMGLSFTNQGHMTAAVAAILPFVFHDLKLHRIEAACLPHNFASMKVLERNGFRREGVARGYLRINGTWQDHVLFALLSDDVAFGGGAQP